MLEAVKSTGYALKYASEELRGDREVVLEAVKQDGRVLVYASKELRQVPKFVQKVEEILNSQEKRKKK